MKKLTARELNSYAKKYSDMFICQQGMEEAERLALRILEKIRASKKAIKEKYENLY